jgi:hypothetical protein
MSRLSNRFSRPALMSVALLLSAALTASASGAASTSSSVASPIDAKNPLKTSKVDAKRGSGKVTPAPATGWLSGTVSTPWGERVAGATIRLDSRDGSTRFDQADYRGRFHLANMPAGLVKITVEHASLGSASTTATVVAGDDQFVGITLENADILGWCPVVYEGDVSQD